jgi:trehalose synthase-fused probable maltokinase
VTTGTGADRARLAAWIDGDLAAAVPAWLIGRRWFASKSRSVEAVAVADVVWLPTVGPARALVVLDVHTRGTGSTAVDRYCLVLGASPEPLATAIGTLPGEPPLHAVEATTEASAVFALLKGLPDGVSLPGESGGRIDYADATSQAASLGVEIVKPVSAEQSNTSMRIGSSLVLKLFRRLEDGINPQLEIGRFLSASGFPHAPRLHGSLTYRAEGRSSSALGALEGWVDSDGDGWSYLTRRLTSDRSPVSPSGELARDLHQLGATTAEFHAALAADPEDDAFRPVPVTADDESRWRQQVWTQADRTLALVARDHAHWREPAAAIGHGLSGAAPIIAARLQAPPGPPVRFDKIRIHGDFHLGQTLKTRTGFMLIDFEGEPSKPLVVRRQKQCALRDVAGLVRSLDYAAAFVGGNDHERRQARGSAATLRAAFLDGYRTRASALGATYLPAAPAGDTWLWWFELEKALYEVEYEANNRPAWVEIPLQAVARLLGDLPP